ncbi:hypothetical protein MesoLj131a_07760 [Mesorhizobium sp. 131-2-1]|nr:hypothetical protein MesoLj131a_07760 [Mesorhizobium sp. 131-2-1]
MALLGQIYVAPAGEQVLQVPFALAVAHEHEGSRHVCSFEFEQFQEKWAAVFRPELRKDKIFGEAASAQAEHVPH